MATIKIFRVNTGSCGGCDVEIAAALEEYADLAWAETPAQADLLLLTGPLTVSARPAFQALYDALGGHVPVLAVGRCAIDGHPFGRGGIAELPAIHARTLDGCPPTPEAIADAVRQLVTEGGAARPEKL